MKPEIYATKKAIAPITIAMVIMIRSRLSSGNMTQDGGISLEYTVACRASSKGPPVIQSHPFSSPYFIYANGIKNATTNHIGNMIHKNIKSAIHFILNPSFLGKCHSIQVCKSLFHSSVPSIDFLPKQSPTLSMNSRF